MREQREKLIAIIEGLTDGGSDKDLLYNLNCLNKALTAYKLISSFIPPDASGVTLNVSPEIIEKIETEILHLR